jgi:phosphohistidine phosphatase
MRLYIVQHGDALPKDADPDRPLSDQGRADIQRLTEWLARHDVRVAQILHSGKTRARETAEILGPLLESDGTIDERQGLAPNDSAEDFLQQLSSEDKDTIIAGHMPFVARAVAQALTGTPESQLVDFAPGSVAVIQRGDGDTWQLVMFVRPENL